MSCLPLVVLPICNANSAASKVEILAEDLRVGSAGRANWGRIPRRWFRSPARRRGNAGPRLDRTTFRNAHDLAAALCRFASGLPAGSVCSPLPQRRDRSMNEKPDSARSDETTLLAVTERAMSYLEELHRRVDMAPGRVLAIQPGDDEFPRFAERQADATDHVVARQPDGRPLLVVPAPVAGQLQGAVLDFVVAPEPGFVVLT
jgi:hypothetical protein